MILIARCTAVRHRADPADPCRDRRLHARSTCNFPNRTPILLPQTDVLFVVGDTGDRHGAFVDIGCQCRASQRRVAAIGHADDAHARGIDEALVGEPLTPSVRSSCILRPHSPKPLASKASAEAAGAAEVRLENGIAARREELHPRIEVETVTRLRSAMRMHHERKLCALRAGHARRQSQVAVQFHAVARFPGHHRTTGSRASSSAVRMVPISSDVLLRRLVVVEGRRIAWSLDDEQESLAGLVYIVNGDVCRRIEVLAQATSCAHLPGIGELADLYVRRVAIEQCALAVLGDSRVVHVV